MSRILLFGASGQVGTCLRHRLAASANIVVAPPRAEADFGDPAKPAALVRAAGPDLIVNAAAYTDVDGAESDREAAFRVNAEAPGLIAVEATRLGVPLIHFSTDYVFDGEARRPYRETDAPRPINVYGESKLAGERAVAGAGAPCVILRTGWVYARTGRNFLTTMRNLARAEGEIRVVDDQVGAPTWAGALADATAALIGRIAARPAGVAGLYHLSASGSTSRYGFARAIFERLGGPAPRLTPVPATAFPTPARRPAFSVLDNARIRDRFGIAMADWESQLAACLSER